MATVHLTVATAGVGHFKHRRMGFHFHFWNLLLACVPSACIIMYFGSVKRETDIPWVNNNAGLAARIKNLEEASFGEAVDESPEADVKRREELLQAGKRVRRQEAALAGPIVLVDEGGAHSGDDDDDEYEDAETQEVVSDLMARVQKLEKALSDALQQLKASATGGEADSATAASRGAGAQVHEAVPAADSDSGAGFSSGGSAEAGAGADTDTGAGAGVGVGAGKGGGKHTRDSNSAPLSAAGHVNAAGRPASLASQRSPS